MNTILIIGHYNSFTKMLINKFYLEQWTIYTLINNKNIHKPKHVIEQYVFDYRSDRIREIIKSCRPAVILYTGAYDFSYKWDGDNINDTGINFTADLNNIIISASMEGVKHFVYISSEIVFQEEYMVDIKEDMPVSPSSYKSIVISLCEKIVLHFSNTSNMETTVVRLDNMYGIPKDRQSCIDPFSKMIIEAMVKGKIRVNGKRIFSSLYIKDAVEALYLFIKADKRKYNLYHISSMDEITGDKLAKLIKDNFTYPIDIIDQTLGLTKRIVLSNKRFSSEFDFGVRNHYEEIIPMMVSYMFNHKKQFLNSDETNNIKNNKPWIYSSIRKVIPFLECTLIFIPVFMLSHGFIKIPYFTAVNFYLLYVLLFAIVHGRQQAIFASLLSLIGYILSQMINSINSAFIIDEYIYMEIIQIFIVGLSVGQIKDRSKEIEINFNEEIDFLKEKLKDITAINSSNRKIKDYYTDKLISSKESIGRIYDITSMIHNSEKGEVLFAALDILTEIMETKDVSIYFASGMKYCRLAFASSSKASSLGKSFEMSKYHMIFDILKMGQVYINKTLDATLPMMASALFDHEENMRIVIFLWDLPYERMTLYNANLLTVVGALIYSAFVRDVNYMEALAYQRYIPETTILQEEAFSEMLDIYNRAKDKGYSKSSVLYIQKDDKSIYEINKIVSPMLRATDYIGLRPDGGLAILLTNTNEKEAVHVIDRLSMAKIKTYLSYSI